MADSHEIPAGNSRFTGFINVNGFPERGHSLFVDAVSQIGAKFTLESPLLEGGCDNPADPQTYVEPVTRYAIAVRYGVQITIASMIRDGALPEDYTTERDEMRMILQEIEDKSNDGTGRKGE